jgi:N-acetylglucosamine-6-phosphate deacetylase
VDGACLGGSAATMNRVVTVFADYAGATLAEALACATTTPARLLERSSLCAAVAPGEPANLIRFRPGRDALVIEQAWQAGEALPGLSS